MCFLQKSIILLDKSSLENSLTKKLFFVHCYKYFIMFEYGLKRI